MIQTTLTQMTMSKLDKEDFVPYAPTDVGDEVHVHHCRQGKNNDRLYIRRTDDGSIVAYCHHCGLSGYYHEGRRRLADLVRRKAGSVAIEDKSKNTITLPSDVIMNPSHWPMAARQWYKQYGITDEEIKDAGICYSHYRGRVIIPTYGNEGKLLQWQGREIQGITDKSSYEKERSSDGERKTISKYYTKMASGTSKREIVQCIVPRRICSDRSALAITTPTLVITEDKLSAIKCARLHDALPLLGSSVKARDLTSLNKYGIIYIFLDNDNSQVKKSQLRLKRNLELIVPKVIVIHSDKDPKECSMQELRDLL